MALSPPPSREKLPVTTDRAGKASAEMPFAWLKWFSDIKELLAPVASGGLILWSYVSKVGSNITDIETRNHADLQNINTATYTHLSSTNATDLTDGGDSTLHYHASDRDSANFTGTSWVDLTDGGATTLHKHDHAAQDNMNSANYTHLTAANATDLTDGGDSTLHYHATDRARANHTGTQDTTTITVASIGGTTTLQNSLNDSSSAGYVDGFAITDTGGGGISVAAGECTLRASASRLAQIYHVTISSPTALSIPLGNIRYVVVDYNAGNPVVQLDTTNPTDLYTKCYLAEIHNPDGTLHIHFDPRATGDIANRLLDWTDGLFGMRVVSGELVSAVATTRTIAVTSGVSWDGHINKYTSAAFDSSGADRFTLEYRDGAGGWTEVTAQSAWPNTQYDDGSGTLVTLGNNKWGVLWVIREWQDGVYIQYGQAEYANQADAEAAAPPAARPEYLTYHGFYIAKIVFEKSATTYAVIQDYRPLVGGSNAGTAVGNHENLSGLLGGAAGDHYHLTGAQNTDLTDGGESSLHYHLSDRIHARNCAVLRA